MRFIKEGCLSDQAVTEACLLKGVGRGKDEPDKGRRLVGEDAELRTRSVVLAVMSTQCREAEVAST